MRLHRFFIREKIEGDRIVVSDERLIHQWRDVFRYNVGSELVMFDGRGFEYDCLIDKITNREVQLSVVSKKQSIMPKNNIVLFQSLVKKDNMEWIAEKTTELDVSKIVPVISLRSEKKGLNLDRIKKIVVEASEQCGRGNVPLIESSQSLEDSIRGLAGKVIVFDPSGIPFDPLLLSTDYQPLSVFIGPEGGWTESEIQALKNRGANVYSLGPLTLRAETAAVAALTIFSL